MHAWFAVASLLLLAATVWMIVADHRRPWREYQRAYRDEVAPALAAALAGEAPAARDVPLGEQILRQPLVDALGRPIAIEQIYLPGLTIDYHFQQVARCDRCITCHVAIDQGGASERENELRRAMAQPFRSHPRLDLYVGPESPHPAEQFGCTICHDGQGSATDFTFASHTPNTPAQGEAWRREHLWRRNTHWEQPMLPARFAESRCVRCHHDPVAFDGQVLSLSAGEMQGGQSHFRDGILGKGGEAAGVTKIGTVPRMRSPGAKLLEGYHLVRQYGCFGCHEINGFDTSGRRVGPDLRLEAKDDAGGAITKLGRQRKVGPNLAQVGDRIDAVVLADRIADPRHFLPDSRMPRLFGLHEHLSVEAAAEAARLEAAEVRAVVALLTHRPTLPQGTEPPPASSAKRGSAERGKRLFAQNGCVACHQHADFPGFEATQGPDLSRAGLKYTGPRADEWLVRWISDPLGHSPRTRMPMPFFESLAFAKDDEAAGSDVAEHIAAYLMACGRAADGEPVWKPNVPPTVSDDDVRRLAEVYEAPPLREPIRGADRAEEELASVGRQAVIRRGCTGCHDVPGVDDAPLIGPSLSGGGRKHVSELAFEQVDALLRAKPPADDSDGFYTLAVLEHRREGFAWQKLRAPRSFDYRLAEKKPYADWLRMGRFNFSPEQREALVTFLLGLTADPPAEKYVARPGARQQAVIAGREVIDELACGQCHTFEMERWSLGFEPNTTPAPPPMEMWPVARPKFTGADIKASLATDRASRRRAELVGMPRVDRRGRVVEDEDDEGNAIRYFTLWQPAVVDGRVWPVGGADLAVREAWIIDRRPPRGGALARWLYPRMLADAQAAGVSAGEMEAWGWLPPPLVGEGAKVQPAWLHEYLLRPRAVRPAAVLRMPQFSLSTAEATALVEYFAAVAGADYPYPEPSELVHPSGEPPGVRSGYRYDPRAMNLLTDRTTFCGKCHIVDEYHPGGQSQTILAPDLGRVQHRLRPEYVERWLAQPKSILPYTAMPVNFPPSGEPLSRDLLPGTSEEQFRAVLDLLLHYDEALRAMRSGR